MEPRYRQEESRPRTVVGRFAKFADRPYVLRNSLMLKGTNIANNIFVNEGLIEATMQARKVQLSALRLATDSDKIAHFIRSRLVICDTKVHPPTSLSLPLSLSASPYLNKSKDSCSSY